MRKRLFVSALVAAATLALTLPTAPAQAQGSTCVLSPEAVIVTKNPTGDTEIRLLGESSGCTLQQTAVAVFLAAMDEAKRQFDEAQTAALLTPAQMIGAEHAQFEPLKNCVLGTKIGDGCPPAQGTQTFEQKKVPLQANAAQ